MKYFRKIYLALKLNLYIIIYHFYKLLYIIINYKNVARILFLIYLIYDEIIYDFYEIKKYHKKVFNNYKKLNIFKHLFLIFFFFAGIVPLIIFFIYLFFIAKYITKYIYFILDFLLDNNDEDNTYYNKIKYFWIFFFNEIPMFIIKSYIYIFKTKWIKLFFLFIKNYFINKKNKILKYFLDKLDNLVLIYIPKKIEEFNTYDWNSKYIQLLIIYYKVKKYIIIIIPWRIKCYLKRIYKRIYILIYNEIYENIIRHNYRKYILLPYNIIVLNYIKILILFSKIYYFIYYKYICIYIYSVWFFKVYLFSYACFVTVEGCILILINNFKTLMGFGILYIFHIFCYFCFTIWLKLFTKIFKTTYYIKLLRYYLIVEKNKIKKYILNNRENFCLMIVYYFVIIKIIFYLNSEFLLEVETEFYETEFGARSQTWWNLKIYQVIEKFFVKTGDYLMTFYKLRFYKYVHMMRIDWYTINFNEKIKINYYLWRIYRVFEIIYWRKKYFDTHKRIKAHWYK